MVVADLADEPRLPGRPPSHDQKLHPTWGGPGFAVFVGKGPLLSWGVGKEGRASVVEECPLVLDTLAVGVSVPGVGLGSRVRNW